MVPTGPATDPTAAPPTPATTEGSVEATPEPKVSPTLVRNESRLSESRMPVPCFETSPAVFAQSWIDLPRSMAHVEPER